MSVRSGSPSGAPRKLLRSLVDRLEPGPRPYDVPDAAQPGFAVRVHPGGTRTYVLRYRPKGAGRSVNPRTLVIGRHPALTPEQARDIAREKLALVAQGKDPGAPDRARVRVSKVLDAHLASLEGKASHRTVKSDVKLHLKPALGHLLASELTPEKVEELSDRLKAEGKATTAGRVVRTLRAALGKARIDAAPARAVKAQGWRKRKRVATPDELRRFFAACTKALETGAVWPWAVHLFLLLVLTGARPKEIKTALREQVSRDRMAIVLAEHKTAHQTGEERVIPLSAAALEIIDAIPAVAGNPYLIPGKRRGECLKVYTKPWAWICDEAGIEGLWTYDLRRAVPSLGIGLGFGLAELGKVLGHANASTTAGYTWLLPDHSRSVVEAVATRLGEIASGVGPRSTP